MYFFYHLLLNERYTKDVLYMVLAREDRKTPMNTIRVALVEDHNLTRMGIRMTLQRSNDVEIVGEAGSGVEGLTLLKNTKPNVAVVDIGLPGIDGIEVIKQFKQFLAETEGPEAPTTRVMMLTLQNDEDAVLAAFAAGADSYCMKDSSAENLLQALQVTYQGGNWIDPAIARIVLRHNRQIQDSGKKGGASGATVAITADNEYSQLLEITPLTARELEVLELIVAGCSNEEIANRLYITVGTVKTHVRNILNKLCADDRTQAAVRALRSGLIA